VFTNKTVKDFQLYGIIVAGDVVATVVSNDLQTSVPAPPGGRFAIEVTSGATGVVAGNIIQGGFQSGGQNVTGILVTDTSGALVSHNCVSGTNFGISLQATCPAPGTSPTTRNVVSFNEVNGSNTGIWLGAQNLTSTICDPHLDGNTVFLNDIEDRG
jgi:hypothetical protein